MKWIWNTRPGGRRFWLCSLFWCVVVQAAPTIDTRSFWNGCLSYITAADPHALYPYLFLPPRSSRVLIAAEVVNQAAERYLLISDYIGSHALLIAATSQFTDSDLKLVVYGGEIRVENRLEVPALGKLTEWNPTSGYLFEILQGGSSQVSEDNVLYLNQPQSFLKHLRESRPDLVAESPHFYTAEERLHLLDDHMGDVRHRYLSYILPLVSLAKERAPLPPEIYDATKKPQTIGEIRKKTEWLAEHLRHIGEPSPAYHGQLGPLLRQWESDYRSLRESDWQALQFGFTHFREDVIRVSERGLFLRLQ